jgi:hypothetical protein
MAGIDKQTYQIEGDWDEVIREPRRFSGRRVRVIVLPDKQSTSVSQSETMVEKFCKAGVRVLLDESKIVEEINVEEPFGPVASPRSDETPHEARGVAVKDLDIDLSHLRKAAPHDHCVV